MSFEKSLEHTLKWEGGYVNHPADPGGATNYGITQATYDAWNGRGHTHVKDITLDEVKQIYRERYWLAGKCDKLPSRLAQVHFDSCVNHGIRQSMRFLQRALGVKDDSVWGPMTYRAVLRTIEDGSERSVIYHYLPQRSMFYHALVERRPQMRVFLRGWLRRLASLDWTTGVL